MSLKSLYQKNKKYFYCTLILIFFLVFYLYLTLVLKLEIKRGGISPNEVYISTSETTKRALTNEELKAYTKSLHELIEKGDKKALSDLTRMAENGIASAQTALAMVYYNDRGIKKDLAKAASLYAAAVEKGDPEAQLNLGFLHENGIQVKQDFNKAAKLYKLVLENKDTSVKGQGITEYNLANLYRQGLGVEKNIDKAITMYKGVVAKIDKTAAFDSTEGKVRTDALAALGHIYREQNQFDIAKEYYVEAAERGSAAASANLGYAYFLGKGVEKNIKKAVELSKFAAEHHDPAGQYNLAICYFEGIVVKKDIPKAIQLLEASAKQDYELAKNMLKALKKPKAKPKQL